MDDWRDELAAVPRDRFVPDLIWLDTDNGYVALRKSDDPAVWHASVSADEPIVTQVDDGRITPGELGRVASSSASQPSIVVDMLAATDIRPGMRVLEIGTGTGWNTALLCRRLGDAAVVSIEVDPSVADAAAKALHGAGFHPILTTGDGMAGYPAVAPYDRVLATVAVVDTVPYEWIAQTRPGGLVVTPWGSEYCNGALLRLVVGHDGTAAGRFSGNLAFMRLRGQRTVRSPADDHVDRDAVESMTELTGAEIYETISFQGAAFAIGLCVPSCHLHVEDDPEDDYRHVVHLRDQASASSATVVVAGAPPFRVRQYGPRPLWTEVDTAYRWWVDAGKPAPERFGITVSPGGQATWLDSPDARLTRPPGRG
jgi:protein-L-isoaspartate O-methyltransferase